MPPGVSQSFLLYGLQLDRLRLQVIAARQRRDGRVDELAKTLATAAKVVAELETARARDGAMARDARLAAQLELSRVEIDLLWAAIGATVDPTLGPDLRELAGSEARHGISLAVYGVLTGLESYALRALSLRLTPLHPLLRYGLLVPSADGSPIASPFTACPRLAAHFAGDDTIDEAVIRVGGVLEVHPDPCFDAVQRACIERIAATLEANEPLVILIEGPHEIGKRTAAAVAARAAGCGASLDSHRRDTPVKQQSCVRA